MSRTGFFLAANSAGAQESRDAFSIVEKPTVSRRQKYWVVDRDWNGIARNAEP